MVKDQGFRVLGFGFGISGLWFRGLSAGFRVKCSGSRVQGSEFEESQRILHSIIRSPSSILNRPISEKTYEFLVSSRLLIVKLTFWYVDFGR